MALVRLLEKYSSTESSEGVAGGVAGASSGGVVTGSSGGVVTGSSGGVVEQCLCVLLNLSGCGVNVRDLLVHNVETMRVFSNVLVREGGREEGRRE